MANKLYEETAIRAIADAIREKNGSSDTYTVGEMPAAIRGISGMDDTVISFDSVNAEVATYLTEAATQYTDSNYSTVSVATSHISADVNNDDPKGYALTINQAGTIYFVDEDDNQRSWHDTVSAGTYTVYNLIPGHTVRWYVVDASGKTTQNGKLKATGNLRMIYNPGNDNARDFGGWPCAGGSTEYGLLYRGYAPYSTSADFISTMRDVCRIKQEIDLRLSGQHDQSGVSVFGADVAYDLFEMSDSVEYRTMIRLTDAWYKTVAAAMRKIMECVILGVPTYIHCSAGADRTGVISFMLQSLLGVSAADCDKNYELTAFAGKVDGSQVTSRVRTNSNFVAFRNYLNSLVSGDSLMDCVLFWCARAGIPAKLVNDFRRAMSSGEPSLVSYNNTITNALTNITNRNTAASTVNGGSYNATLELASGAVLEQIVVTMNGADITANAVNGLTISIPEVDGDIIISASAVINTVSVSTSLSNVVFSGGNYATKGTPYTATIAAKPAALYEIGSIKVTMGGSDVTASAVSGSNISIANVTGAISITASGKLKYENKLAGLSYTNGVRVNSSGGTTAQSGMVTTGWIPYTPGCKIISNLPFSNKSYIAWSNDGTTQRKYYLSGTSSVPFPSGNDDYSIDGDGVCQFKMAASNANATIKGYYNYNTHFRVSVPIANDALGNYVLAIV